MKKVKIQDIEDVIILSTVGASGSIFFHSLLDKHEELIHIPIFAINNYFEWVNYIEKEMLDILFEEKIEIHLDSFIKNYIFIFDFEKTVLAKDSFNKCNRNASQKFFLGERNDKNEFIHKKVDEDKFKQKAKKLLLEHKKIDKGSFFKAIHLAYHYAVYDIESFNKIPKIIFDSHSGYQNYYIDNLTPYFKNIKGLINLRSPYKAVESFAKRVYYDYIYLNESNPNKLSKKYINFFLTNTLNCLSYFASCNINRFYLENTRVVILEDLHQKTDLVLNSLCKFLDISYSDTLKESTFNAVPWTWIPEGKKHGIYNKKGFGLAKDDSEEFLTKEQKDAINFIFSNLCETYNMNYNKNFSLERLQKVLEEGFKFEKNLDKIEILNDLDILAIKAINKATILEFLSNKDFWEERTLPKNILEEKYA